MPHGHVARGLPTKELKGRGDGEDSEEENPTVVRLSKELREEKANGRLLKKNWRQAQADQGDAQVEVVRLKQQLQFTVIAMETSQRLEAKLELDLGVKQTQFMESDVRASFLNRDLYKTQTDLGKLEVVEKQYTKDIVATRTENKEVHADVKKLSAEIVQLKKEVVMFQDQFNKVETEAKALRIETARCRTTEADAKAQCFDVSRRLGLSIQEVQDIEKHRVDTEAYAHKMRGAASEAEGKLKHEKELTKSLTAKLKAMTDDHLSERDQRRKAGLELQSEQQTTLGLRKGKSEAENVARGVQRGKNAADEELAERAEQIQILRNSVAERVADIAALQKKLEVSETKLKETTGDLKKTSMALHLARGVADQNKNDYKRVVEDIKGVRKEVGNEKNATLSVARELRAVQIDLKQSNVHSEDCDEVIARLSADLAKETQKVKAAEAVIVRLKDDVQKSEDRFHNEQHKVADLQGSCKAVAEELGLTKREAKDHSLAASKLGMDVFGAKRDAAVSEKESIRIAESLEQYRKDLLASDTALKDEHKKVTKLHMEIAVHKSKIESMQAVITEHQGEMNTVLEIQGMAERQAQGATRMTELVGSELHKARQLQKEAESSLAPVEEVGARAMQIVARLEVEVKDAGVVIEGLRKEAAAAKIRADKAESINHGHEKLVAELEDVAALARGHDSTASAMTTKMASRLYEAQNKLPPLEQEVAIYKDQVDRMLVELTELKAAAPKLQVAIKKLTKELEVSKGETRDWKAKIGAVEEQIPPLSNQVLFLKDALRDEESLKKEMVKQLHANRKRTAEAETEAKELTSHVQRLIDQLNSSSKDPKSPKSPKSPANVFGMAAKGKAAPAKTSSNMASLLKGSASLPAIKK